ncbi:MAG: 4-hydroxy-3-methylbut-2-enyl diphosphate reductase [Blastocatellia bacterium]|nr:4-hydroxy-3-methylbut-2-enyl diphosphate reductase [Blastocatellia bacterium]
MTIHEGTALDPSFAKEESVTALKQSQKNAANPARSGFGLRDAVKEEVTGDYDSPLVAQIRLQGNLHQAGRITFRLAKEFGFCYGVDHALSLAYETHRRFPDKTIYLTGEIIHNPSVNQRLQEMGYRFLTPQDVVTEKDVVLIPAFGTPVDQLSRLQDTGCLLVDTTCGSVVHVWNRVERYAKDGFTAVIHGKYHHEETEATRSQTQLHQGGKYLVVRDREETQEVCDFILGNRTTEQFQDRFKSVASPDFNPERDLQRIGLANQTTMLSSESLEIADMLRQAIEKRHGQDEIKQRFRSFDTICSATQERQDAVLELIQEPLDLMLVLGGYNSSNTTHLAEISALTCPTFHIDKPDCLLSATKIRHQPVHSKSEIISENWLPTGVITIGVTAGASTPNRVVGDCIERIVELTSALQD